ncbi:MAG: hypothetical protein V4539_20010 [Bacteroidota bacterium]
MRHDAYENLDIKEDLSMFQFSSIGTRDTILKKILFTPTGITGLYNLSLGDIGADGQIDDTIISNNGDRNKILATVVGAIFKYTERYPNRFVVFNW